MAIEHWHVYLVTGGEDTYLGKFLFQEGVQGQRSIVFFDKRTRDKVPDGSTLAVYELSVTRANKFRAWTLEVTGAYRGDPAAVSAKRKGVLVWRNFG